MDEKVSVEELIKMLKNAGKYPVQGKYNSETFYGKGKEGRLENYVLDQRKPFEDKKKSEKIALDAAKKALYAAKKELKDLQKKREISSDAIKAEAEYTKKIQELTQEIDKQKEAVKEHKKAIGEATEGIKFINEHKASITAAEDKQIRKETFSILTNGRNEQIQRSGSHINDIGNALKGVLGENSSIGKLFNGWGDFIQDNANSIAVLQMGIEKITNAIITGFQTASTFLQLSAQESETLFNQTYQKRNLEFQRGMAEFDTAIQVTAKKAQAEVAYTQAMAQAEFSKYTNALDSKITAFTDITGSVYKALNTSIEYKYATAAVETERTFAVGDDGKGNRKDGGATSLSLLENKLNTILGKKQESFKATEDVVDIATEHALNTIKNQRKSQVSGLIGMGTGAAVGGYFAGPQGAAVGAAVGKGMSDAYWGWQQQLDDYYYGLQEQASKLQEQTVKNQESWITKAQESLTNLSELSTNSQKEIILNALKTNEKIEKALANFAETIDKQFVVMENSANEIGVGFGYVGEQLDVFKSNLFKTQVSVSQWGKTIQDMQKLQQNYTETTGRNIEFSQNDYNKSFAMGVFWGDDTISQLNAQMEPFNKSVADSNEMFFEMHKSVLRMGLDSRKFGKDLVSNLKLAQKYNFKGGVKDLMEMSKWAQNVRFNTGSLDGMLSKVQEGGLEGIIKQSAGLQVLGGRFAMGADPLAMGFEAFNDSTAYAKRVNGMLEGLGHFNSQTGEVEVIGADRMIANQAATLLGQSVEDTIAQIKQSVKLNKIKSSLNGNFNEEQQAMIANKAQYMDGSWKVNLGKKDAQGNDIMTDVSNITAEDLKLLDNNTNLTLEQTAHQSLSLQQQEFALQQTMQSDQYQFYDFFKKEHMQRMQNIWSDYLGNAETWHNNITKYVEEATTEANALNKFYNENTPEGLGQKYVSYLLKQLNPLMTNVQSIKDTLAKKYNIDSAELQSVANNADLLKLKQYIDKTGYKQTITNLQNSNSTLYDDKEMTAVIERLRENPLDLLKIKDAKLKEHLAKAIYEYDDWGTTTNFDFHENEELSKYMYKLYPNEFGKTPASISQTKKDWIYGLENGGTKGGIQNFHPFNADDGFISQNGSLTRIDSNDQVLAAKSGGPIDKMLDMVQPRPMAYDSYVIPNMRNGSLSGIGNNGKLKIDPININLGGNLTVNGKNIDINAQLDNKEFQGALMTFIFEQVSKTVNNTGKMTDPLYNRIQNSF